MKLRIGEVGPAEDGTRSGLIWADVGGDFVPVEYVTPYGHKDAAFIAIPPEGSQILVGETEPSDDPSDGDTQIGRYYYLGSILGGTQGKHNSANIAELGVNLESMVDLEATVLGGKKDPEENLLTGNPGLSTASDPDGSKRVFPNRLNSMYDGKGGVPEQLGLVSENGSAFLISDQSEAGVDGQEGWQNYQIEMKSGSGKVIECVDSPKINAIIMTPRPDKKDKLVFSSGNTTEHSKSEFKLDTEGPVYMYSRNGEMDFICRDGRNIKIINTSPVLDGEDTLTTGGNINGGYPDTGTKTDGRGSPHSKGNEEYGCVNIESLHNNINLTAKAHDSVIYINAPGPSSKVVVTTGGSVDILAEKKITMTSNEAIEMNAPHVDINGGDRVDITAPNIWIDNNGDRHKACGSSASTHETQATIKLTDSGGLGMHGCEDIDPCGLTE